MTMPAGGSDARALDEDADKVRERAGTARESTCKGQIDKKLSPSSQAAAPPVKARKRRAAAPSAAAFPADGVPEHVTEAASRAYEAALEWSSDPAPSEALLRAVLPAVLPPDVLQLSDAVLEAGKRCTALQAKSNACDAGRKAVFAAVQRYWLDAGETVGSSQARASIDPVVTEWETRCLAAWQDATHAKVHYDWAKLQLDLWRTHESTKRCVVWWWWCWWWWWAREPVRRVRVRLC